MLNRIYRIPYIWTYTTCLWKLKTNWDFRRYIEIQIRKGSKSEQFCQTESHKNLRNKPIMKCERRRRRRCIDDDGEKNEKRTLITHSNTKNAHRIRIMNVFLFNYPWKYFSCTFTYLVSLVWMRVCVCALMPRSHHLPKWAQYLFKISIFLSFSHTHTNFIFFFNSGLLFVNVCMLDDWFGPHRCM